MTLFYVNFEFSLDFDFLTKPPQICQWQLNENKQIQFQNRNPIEKIVWISFRWQPKAKKKIVSLMKRVENFHSFNWTWMYLLVVVVIVGSTPSTIRCCIRIFIVIVVVVIVVYARRTEKYAVLLLCPSTTRTTIEYSEAKKWNKNIPHKNDAILFRSTLALTLTNVKYEWTERRIARREKGTSQFICLSNHLTF